MLRRLIAAAEALVKDYRAKAVTQSQFESAYALLINASTEGQRSVSNGRPTEAALKKWIREACAPLNDVDWLSEDEVNEMEPRLQALALSVTRKRAQWKLKIYKNETAAKGGMLTIRTAQTLYREKKGRYASRLETLASSIRLGRLGKSAGYRYELVGSDTEWVVIASPRSPGASGKLYFAADANGIYEADDAVFEARLPFTSPSSARNASPR